MASISDCDQVSPTSRGWKLATYAASTDGVSCSGSTLTSTGVMRQRWARLIERGGHHLQCRRAHVGTIREAEEHQQNLPRKS
jgi:hypothetical protein